MNYINILYVVGAVSLLQQLASYFVPHPATTHCC